jgi:thiosulfate/3-mercaptopyruvate sulfurtransferase
MKHASALAVTAGVIASLACGSAAWGQTPSLLVTVDWLSQHLNDPKVVVLHVGDKASYDAGHIPGARSIVEDDVAKPHDMAAGDLMLELPSPETIRAKLRSLGISDDSTIVVYAGKNTVLQSATRIVFTLDYVDLGRNTVLLNGGIEAWRQAGKTVSNAAPPVATGTLANRLPRPVVVDADFVKTVGSLPNHRLVDARAPVFYSGKEPTFGKKGHIPGAINIPFTDISDSNGLIDRDHLAHVFSAAGIKPGDTVVAYCHVGQQATAVIFAARLLGYPAVLYDGAFQDWATRNRGATEP